MATVPEPDRRTTGRWYRSSGGPWPAQPAALVAVRIGGLALLLWAVFSEAGRGTSGEHLALWLLAASLVPAWLLWTGFRREPGRLQLLAFVWLAAAGGAVAGLVPIGLAYIGTAALGAAAACELPTAAVIAACGPAATLATVAVDGRAPSLVLAAVAVALTGLVLGVGRRQHVERAQQAVLVAVEHDRAEVERGRAAVLAERNRLAREVHDVLAHTLGALTVQLEALDAQLEGSDGPASAVRDGVRRTRSLAVEGLAEARRAVQALRDDLVPLGTQLEGLCQLHGATLDLAGAARTLSPEVTLALYRVAQEALTNAAKHAPGAPVTVRLGYEPGTVRLAVANGPGRGTPGELARTGGGFGLDGIRERLQLLGGAVTAGPADGGWLVEARVPA